MKKFMMLGITAVAAVTITGCRWCDEKVANDPSCVTYSHEISVNNSPATTGMVTPNIAISREVFRPVFRAGSGRLTVEGSGIDVKDATYDAISKFLAKANCDYIVAVSTVSVRTDHPKAWWDILCWCHNSDHRFFTLFPLRFHLFCTYNTNYKVTISGIPVYLDKLSTETLDSKKVELFDMANGLYLPARGYDTNPEKVKRAFWTPLKDTSQVVMSADDKAAAIPPIMPPAAPAAPAAAPATAEK